MPEFKKTFRVADSRVQPQSIKIQLLAKYLGKSETEILRIFPGEELLGLLRRTEILIEHLRGSENELLERFETPPPTGPDSSKPAHQMDSLRIRDAGLFSYTAGLVGAAVFMALAVGPGWLGFIAAFLPASALAAWEVSLHD